MKRTIQTKSWRKLSLSRETMKRLDEPGLAEAVGGASTSCTCLRCIYPSNANISACDRCFN